MVHWPVLPMGHVAIVAVWPMASRGESLSSAYLVNALTSAFSRFSFWKHRTLRPRQPHGQGRQALSGVSNPWPAGHMRPRMAVNVAQQKIVNLLKTFFFLLISFC